MNKIFAKISVYIILILMIFCKTSVYAHNLQGWAGPNDGKNTNQNFVNNISSDHKEYIKERKETQNKNGTDGKSTNGDWISDAFQAVKSFFNEDVKDDLGIVATPLDFFRSVIKGINRILLVLLAAISSISLAIVGIRYLMSTNSAEQQKKAVKDLHTTFKGMAFGFGAFFIWRIAMGIVEVIISNL